jgi:maleylpyruvate isomerase
MTTIQSALSRHLEWMASGHQHFLERLEDRTDANLHEPIALPGWTGRHLLSHVGHNAQALGRLAHWAASGEPTLMYRDADARAAEIEVGATWPARQLRAFVADEQSRLASSLDALGPTRWAAEVVTAQGRTVPASVIPWLRARELWIHASDLHGGDGFERFPPDFVDELVRDVLTRRRAGTAWPVRVRAIDRPYPVDPHDALHDDAERVEGPAAALARWLTGRGGTDAVRTNSGAELPKLSPWL